jgi:hypothetical protein
LVMRAREVPEILAISVTVRSLLSELEMILLVICSSLDSIC